jgi:hypothetical protein
VQRGLDAEAIRLQQVLRADYLHHPALVEEDLGQQALALLRQLDTACGNDEHLAGWLDRSWTCLTGALLGYGYRPARALAHLVGALAVSVGLAFGTSGALAQTPDPAAPPTATARSTAAATMDQPCTTLQLVGKGLDLGTPFFPTAPSGAAVATSPPQRPVMRSP